MAVSGVRSSCDTEDMNSLCTRSALPIFTLMSFMASVSAPISSSRSRSARVP